MIVYSLPTCTQCRVLKSKLKEKNINFTIIEDIDIMNTKGIRSVPVLELEDGTILTQVRAIKWVDNYEG